MKTGQNNLFFDINIKIHTLYNNNMYKAMQEKIKLWKNKKIDDRQRTPIASCPATLKFLKNLKKISFAKIP